MEIELCFHFPSARTYIHVVVPFVHLAKRQLNIAALKGKCEKKPGQLKFKTKWANCTLIPRRADRDRDRERETINNIVAALISTSSNC